MAKQVDGKDELLDITNKLKDIQRMQVRARKELLYNKEEGELLQINCNRNFMVYHAERLYCYY